MKSNCGPDPESIPEKMEILEGEVRLVFDDDIDPDCKRIKYYNLEEKEIKEDE